MGSNELHLRRYIYLSNFLTQVKHASISSKRAVFFFLGNERCPFANDSIFWVNSVQRLDQTSWQTSDSVHKSVWMIRSVLCRTRWVAWSGSLRVVTERLRTSRVSSAAARDLFQEECLCPDTIVICIFTIFMLAEIQATFVYMLQNGRKKIFQCALVSFCSDVR